MSATDLGKTRARDIGSGKPPKESVSVTASVVAQTAPAALSQAAVTDALNGATFTGTELATSSTPTLDELEANDGVIGLALNAARDDIIALRGEVVLYEVAITALIADLAALRTELVAMNIVAA